MIAAYHELVRIFRVLGWAGTIAISLGLAVGSLALAAFIVVRWSHDHFKNVHPPPFLEHHPAAVRVAAVVGKNLAGYLIVIMGIIMALPGVPGQGVLLILIGTTLLNFPGKRRLELNLIRRPSILRAVNTLRQRFGRPALDVE